jgi:hypothetical protein
MLTSIDGQREEIIMTYHDLNQKDFYTSFDKMLKLQGLGQQAKYEIKKVGDCFVKELKRMEQKAYGLVVEFAEKGPNGQPLVTKIDNKDQYVFTDEEAYKSAFAKLMASEFTLSRKKIKYKLLDHADISPKDLMALDKIIDFPVEEA